MRSEEKNRWIECGRGGTQTLTNDPSSITNEEKNHTERGGKGKKKKLSSFGKYYIDWTV